MLRSALLVLGVGLIAAGLFLARFAVPGMSWHLVFWGALLILAVLFEHWRYRGASDGSQAGWTATGERFEDPETGKIVEVFYRPGTGERRYSPVDAARPPN